MKTPWIEWRDSYRVVLTLNAITELSTAEIKLAYDMGSKYYEQGLDEMDAMELAMKEVKSASPEALVEAELKMAKHRGDRNEELEKLKRKLGIDPDTDIS